MAVLSAALVIAAIVGAFVTGGALDSGFPFEIAIVRGALAFMAVAFAGYLGELVVVTAPKRERTPASRPAERNEPMESKPVEPKTVLSPPQLMAPAQPAAERNDEDDASGDIRQAA